MAEPLDQFLVRFWGVRGSIACPGARTIRYGGNTSCIELTCGDKLLILDAGTGLHPLGGHLMGDGPVDADLFLTHTHFDHICGFPFFAPAFVRDTQVRVWAGHLAPKRGVKEVLMNLMVEPLFPVPMDEMNAQLSFEDFNAGDTLAPQPGITVKTAPLNHPNGATGYRVEYEGRSVCYVTDTEHIPGVLDETIITLVRDADLMIYDSTYTDAEFPNHVNWGHSTWQEGARLADAAEVKRLVVFHHNPDHDDDFMDTIAHEVALRRPGSIVAQEGMTLRA